MLDRIKMLFTILCLMIAMSCSGCGIYNLGSFTIPNDTQFLETIDELDTPQKISDYMLNNFSYELHPLYAITPYELFLSEKGDCNDFACFATFIADYHGYDTYQVRITFYGTIYSHCIGVYAEGMYSFTDNRTYHYGFDTFRDIVNESGKYTGLEWKSYKVFDYENNTVEVGKKGD